MRLTVAAWLVGLAVLLISPAADARVAVPPAAPPAACRMLPMNVADWYMTGKASRILRGPQICGYRSGADATYETLSLHAVGPLPAAAARANYRAAYRAALGSADTTRRLSGIGPREAFGFESTGDGRGTASVVFLAGRYTGVVAIDAPALTGDADIEELSRLVRREIWPRWTRRRP